MSSVEIMTPSMIERMRKVCQLAADTLLYVGDNLRVGMTTDEINTLVHGYTLSHDAIPAPLGYGQPPFPKSVCTSVNEVVCHGIPDKYALKNGDIINVDVTPYFPKKNGFHGDTSATFYVGTPSADAKLVTEVARKCLELGIETVKHGSRIGDIGRAIQEYAEGRGCGVVREYVGHGVGREFHTKPQVPHCFSAEHNGRVKAGMVFTIEPMINAGGYECEVLADEWTVLTKDRRVSAQFEHTILVTRTGCEVLTARSRVLRHSEDVPWAEVWPMSSPAAWAARNEGKSAQAAQ